MGEVAVCDYILLVHLQRSEKMHHCLIQSLLLYKSQSQIGMGKISVWNPAFTFFSQLLAGLSPDCSELGSNPV